MSHSRDDFVRLDFVRANQTGGVWVVSWSRYRDDYKLAGVFRTEYEALISRNAQYSDASVTFVPFGEVELT